MKRIILLLMLVALLVVGCGESATPTPESTATPLPTVTPVATDTPVSTVVEFGEVTTTVGDVNVALANVRLPEGDTIALVNGAGILTEAYSKELGRQLASFTMQYGLDWNNPDTIALLPQIQDNILEQLIDLELIAQLADRDGVVIADETVNQELETAKASVMASGQFPTWEDFLTLNDLTEQEAWDAVAESVMINQMIELHGGPTVADQVHAVHILVADEATAAEVMAKLADGAEFAALAAEYSTDTGTAEDGGDLGWFPRGAMVAEFEDAAFSQPIDEVGEPVQTTYGFHIIKVLGHEERALEGDALTQQQQTYFSEWYETERSAADVTKLIDFLS